MKFYQKFFFILLISILILSLGGCEKRSPVPYADLVIKNAKVVTIDKDNPRAEAIAVKKEHIMAVTSNGKIEKYIKYGKTKVIDARGRLLVPGFNDAHVHFLSGGESLMILDLRGISHIKEIQKLVKQRVNHLRPGELVMGRGWDHELFIDKIWPGKEILDEVAPENPVVLYRIDGHTAWVNSNLMKISDISKDTPSPPGGNISRDADTGEPTGIFKETAVDLLKIDDKEKLTGLELRQYNIKALHHALAEAKRTGVTSIQHLYEDADLLQFFHDEGRLTVRVTFSVRFTDEKKQLELAEKLREKYPPENNWLRFGYLKEFIDGTLGSGTAFMFSPYTDDDSTCGLPRMSYEKLKEKVLEADSKGFQIGIHAIGTKANHWVLNAYEQARIENGKRDSRHRIEHAQILIAKDIDRFAELNVLASMQPTHCITDKRFAENRLGKKRCLGAYAWQSLLETGAHIAFGTDWPVEPLNPLEGLYAAVTRKDRAGETGHGWYPEQRIAMEKAIELYTLGSAHAEFMEHRKGSIKKGMLADMIIFSADLMQIPPDEILKTKVDYTIVGGRVVYQRKGI